MGFDSLRTDPMKSINWHIHRNGCPHYREHWPKGTDLEAGEPLYQVFCGMNTPPASTEEQSRCLTAKNGCWRYARRSQKQPGAECEDAVFPNL